MSTEPKLTALDGLAVVILSPAEFATVRMAPYPGWETLVANAVGNLQAFRDVVGFRKITHLGARFINRIDVPVISGKPIPVQDYLLIGPSLPTSLGHSTIEAYFNILQVRRTDKVRFNLQTGSVGEVLIGHASFLLDIDAIWAGDMPQSIEAISSALVDLRHAKNEVFEACVGDSSRTLFEASPL